MCSLTIQNYDILPNVNMFTFAYVNMFTVACRVSKLLRVLGGRVEAGGFFFSSKLGFSSWVPESIFGRRWSPSR